MSRRRIIGYVLTAVSLVLAVIVVTEIKKTVILKGPWAGTVYTPPFPFHGPLVVVGGIAAFVLFLVGIHQIRSDRRR